MIKINKIFMLLLLMLLSACGSDGYPKPDMKHEIFTWHNLSAVSTENCFSVSGYVGGNIKNIRNINLELEEVDETCLDCPFVPKTIEVYEVKEVLDTRTGVFSLNYCPISPAESYRWRLAGHNVEQGLPIMYSIPQVVDMK